MKKIALIILAVILAFSIVACAEKKQDLTSISEYMPPATTVQIDTGTLHFTSGIGDSAIITDYVGLYTEHVVTVPEIVNERTVSTIGKEAFYFCTSVTEIILPDTVYTIEDFAFAGCTSLEKIVIPASVISIGDFAFYGCESLKTVIFEGTSLKSIGDYAFFDCENLETIALPEGLVTIGNASFFECKSLTKITAPSTLKEIGTMAFYDCEALNTDGALTLTASIENIGEYAFTGINKEFISAPEGSYAAEYVAEMREFEEETEAE